MHTTNYHNTFIEIAEDCAVVEGEVPPQKGERKTMANLQFEMIRNNPYKFTSDDVIFGVHADRNDNSSSERKKAREAFFSKGQACLRCSPLAKRYGWGVHSNAEGKVAIFPVDSEEYQRFATDGSLEHVKAMRSKRK